MEPTPDSSQNHYDLVVIGGAFAGASFATLLRRSLPRCRILVIERAQRFERKVGEATVEISAHFLHRILGVYDHLSRQHLPKHGLRYWFTDDQTRSLEEMTEVGPKGPPSLPAFQLDRPKLDEHLLSLAAQEGCELLRPARVLEIEHGWPQSTVKIEVEGQQRCVQTRWVVDASGRHSFIARRKRLRQRVEEHPTAAVWGRWDGVADLDGPEIMGKDHRQGRLPETAASRRLATNHFCGYGWWCWLIPLAHGQTSIGVVYNKELFQLPGEGNHRQRYLNFVNSHSGLRELVAGAELNQEDCLSFNHLPYKTKRYIDHGWALVGDSASFLDPYYSPGLDHAAISVYATARLIEKDLKGELAGDALAAEIERHNGDFLRSYDRWMEALYLGKYELFGDAELTTIAFLFDTAMYYLGIVTPAFSDLDDFANPLFGPDTRPSRTAHWMMRGLNQRLLKLARFRRQAGTYGRHNVHRRIFSRVFALGPRAAVAPLAHALRLWLGIEWEHLIYRLRHGRVDVSQPVPLQTEAAQHQPPAALPTT